MQSTLIHDFDLIRKKTTVELGRWFLTTKELLHCSFGDHKLSNEHGDFPTYTFSTNFC